MSDDLIRERLETSKQRARVFREWSYFALAGLVALMLIWALWSFRNAQNVVGATQSQVKQSGEELSALIKEGRDTVAEVRGKVKALDVERLNKRLDDLGDSQKEFTRLIADTRLNETRMIDRLDANLISVKGLTDEARVQVKQNGDKATEALGSLDALIKTADTKVSKLADDGSLLIETTNDELQVLLDNLQALTVSADGTIKAYQPVGVNLAGVTEDLRRMTSDSAAKWHSILFPDPVKGFWPNLRRAASYAYRPAFDGIRLYYTLKSLPVRITQPIPVIKP